METREDKDECRAAFGIASAGKVGGNRPDKRSVGRQQAETAET